ncbi:MAG TPA: ABC transporter ATP-binding protein [bacterium]|nr:ABC transporter ATP-binding protein [bacterium]
MALLEVSGLTKYFGGVRALNGVGVAVNAAEIVGLIGPNGSGKTTFVNAATGLVAPDAGRVILTDRDVTGIPAPAAARAGLARTFQSPRPFLRMTVLENVAVAALLRAPRVPDAFRAARDVLELVGLASEADTPASALPSERRKRLDLARALAVQPRVLFLDEVMAGLNPTEQEEGIALIRRVNALGIAIVYIEHVMETVVTLCPRVIVLNHGDVIAAGRPGDVLSDPVVVEAYLGSGDAPD